ncbi:MAG: SRPBCC family protein [Polyangiaceae bacterium]
MNREVEIALLRGCLELVQRGAPPATEPETLVPVKQYLDPARFAAERAALFASQPMVVGHGAEIREPGDFVTRLVLDQPAILVRDEAGRARAFLNVCRHRGATVELRERGHCKRFTCPYHAWTYDTAGRLAAIRHKAGFPSLDRATSGLVELACHELAGLMWVCPDPSRAEAPPQPDDLRLAAELEGLLGGLTRADEALVFASTTRVYRANYKLIVDGGLESYHFRVAHRDTVGPFFADNVHSYEPIGRHLRTLLPRLSILDLASRPEDEWRIREASHLVYSVAPNASVLVQEGHVDVILNRPLAVDATEVTILSVVPRPGEPGHSERAAAFWTKNHAFTARTLDEDFVLAEQIQRGMASGANESFRFANFEGALTAWHRQLDARLAGST